MEFDIQPSSTDDDTVYISSIRYAVEIGILFLLIFVAFILAVLGVITFIFGCLEFIGDGLTAALDNDRGILMVLQAPLSSVICVYAAYKLDEY